MMRPGVASRQVPSRRRGFHAYDTCGHCRVHAPVRIGCHGGQAAACRRACHRDGAGYDRHARLHLPARLLHGQACDAGPGGCRNAHQAGACRDAERAAGGWRRHHPGLDARGRVPDRVSRRPFDVARTDDARDERHRLRRDDARQPRVQLRTRKPDRCAQRRALSLAVCQHPHGQRHPAVRAVPRQDGGGRQDRHHRRDDGRGARVGEARADHRPVVAVARRRCRAGARATGQRTPRRHDRRGARRSRSRPRHREGAAGRDARRQPRVADRRAVPAVGRGDLRAHAPAERRHARGERAARAAAQLGNGRGASRLHAVARHR